MTVIQMNIFITYFYYLFEFNTSKLLNNLKFSKAT